MKTLFITAAFVLLVGCSTPASLIKQLKDDPASARVRITGWGVVIELDRTAPRTNSMPHVLNSDRIAVGGDVSH